MYTRPVGLVFQGETPLVSCLMGGEDDEGLSSKCHVAGSKRETGG